MAVNLDKPHLWKSDISQSVDMYNDWFMNFAPSAFRETRVKVTQDVEETLRATENLTKITPEILRRYPGVLPTLRMSTCPPLAVDRLIGLASVPSSLVKRMEKEKKLPIRLQGDALDIELRKIGKIIERMADPDIFTWLNRSESPSQTDIHRAATIVADRLCGSVTNPIIRNAQERRQLAVIQNWLETCQYRKLVGQDGVKFDQMTPGTFCFRMNVPVNLETGKVINIPVDVAIKPKSSSMDELPVFLEAKSAGDFTNVNKRRKEEAIKMSQLRSTYGDRVQFNLFLCGYFDSGYLGYEAAEGIDWVWEHRIDDLAGFGL
jgi:type II restriction enzyme